MRIHQQHSLDSTTTEAAIESEKTSVKERADSDASTATTNTNTEMPKKKRSSGGAKAKIAMNLPPGGNTKIGGRYEPHQPNQKHNRVSPTYSNESANASVGGGVSESVPNNSIPNEIETFLNNAASPPRYKPSEEDELANQVIPNGIMTNSTSSAMSVMSQKLSNGNGMAPNGIHQFENSGYGPPVTQPPPPVHESAADRRSHFVVSRTFDEYSAGMGNNNSAMDVANAASRSLHDLRFQQQQHQHHQQQQQPQYQQLQYPPMPGGHSGVRQPPNYHAALHQLTQHQQQQPPPSHRPYGAMPPPSNPPPPQMSAPVGHPLRPARWPTVNGTDPDIMMLIERMNLQNQQLIPPNGVAAHHPPIPRKQNSVTIEQQQEQFGVHRGVSEPRLNLNVHQGSHQQQQQQAHLMQLMQNHANSVNAQRAAPHPFTHQHHVGNNSGSSSGGNGNAVQKKRRYTSQSPSSRGINRVKSMPAASAALMVCRFGNP